MKDTKTLMREKPIFPLLLSMSVPVVLSMLIGSLYNIVDSIWVTKLGTDALTAVSLAFPLQNALMSVGVGMGVGIGSVVSLRLGAEDREGASRAASFGMLLVSLHCLAFLAAGLLVVNPFLKMFTTDPQILDWACEYSRIVMCLSAGNLLQMAMEKIFQGAGKMTTTMFLMASGGIVNMVLDPILIFGLCGFPAMGVRGAAIATVIGQVVGLLLYLIVYRVKDVGLWISPKYAAPDWSLARQIYGVGLPSSLTLAMPSLLTGIINGILVSFGNLYVAVFGLYFKLQSFVNMPTNGIVQGMRPIIGYNYGAGNKKRVREAIRWASLLIAIMMTAGTLLAVVFPRQVLQLFDAEPDLLTQGALALQLIGPSFLLSTVSVTACGVFEALGLGRDSLVVSILRQLVLLVPLAWLLSRFWGVCGIWLAFPLAELATLFVAIQKLRHCPCIKE